MKYEVTNTTNNVTKVLDYHAVRVIINSNSAEKARENFAKLDALEVDYADEFTDNYGSMGGGRIVIERVA